MNSKSASVNKTRSFRRRRRSLHLVGKKENPYTMLRDWVNARIRDKYKRFNKIKEKYERFLRTFIRS